MVCVRDSKSHPERGPTEGAAVTVCMRDRNPRPLVTTGHLLIDSVARKDLQTHAFRVVKRVLGVITGERLGMEKSPPCRARGLR